MDGVRGFDVEGALIVAGGNIDTGKEQILSGFIRRSGGPAASILVAVTASGSHPDDIFEYIATCLEDQGLGPGQCRLLPLYEKNVRDRQGRNLLTGDAPGIAQYLDGIGGVWFTGGDQYYVRNAFVREDGSDTKLLARLRALHAEGLCIGGSSAGAAIMSRTMIGGGSNKGVLHRETLFSYEGYDQLCEEDPPCPPLIITGGLGFFPCGVVDQHFDARPRLLRLIEACFMNPSGQRLGFAVSEDTAFCYQAGSLTVLGAGSVYVVDTRQASRVQKGEYRDVGLMALQAGDSLDCAGWQVRLAKTGKAGGNGFKKEYIPGGMVHHPGFDTMIIDGLLYQKSELLFDSPGGRHPCVLACCACEAGGTSYALQLSYARTPDALGYLGDKGKASFSGVCLSTRWQRFNTWKAAGLRRQG